MAAKSRKTRRQKQQLAERRAARAQSQRQKHDASTDQPTVKSARPKKVLADSQITHLDSDELEVSNRLMIRSSLIIFAVLAAVQGLIWLSVVLGFFDPATLVDWVNV